MRPRFPGLIELLAVGARRDPAVRRTLADARLRQLVTFAHEHVPLYREVWRSAGVKPGEIRSAADLTRLPFVDKEMIVGAGADARAASLLPQVRAKMRTSGTSGRAIEIVRIQAEMAVTRRAILRHVLSIGGRPWHRVLTLGSRWLSQRRGWVVSRFVKTRFLEPLMPVNEQIAALREFAPAALIGQTGGIYLLARELLRRGEPYPLRWVLPTGATLVPHMRQAMRAAFGVDPYDMYGAIELGPVSWQCRRHSYHIDADRIIVEIVDHAGRPVPPGTPGQVVCTSLHGFTMPLIRYRLHDVSTLLPGECGCGCRFPLMGAVQGRVNDFIPTPAGDLVSPHFFFHLFDACQRNPVQDWRVVQHSRDALTYEYVPEPWFDEAEFAIGARVLRERFGAGCEIKVRRVEEIALTPAGKQRCIHSALRPEPTDWRDAWAECATFDATQASPVEVGA